MLVTFAEASHSNSGRNLVTINAETREIVAVSTIYNVDEKLNVKIDDSKVKKAAETFIKRFGKSISINAKNYSVMNYQVNFNKLTKLPSRVKEEKANFKVLKIK